MRTVIKRNGKVVLTGRDPRTIAYKLRKEKLVIASLTKEGQFVSSQTYTLSN